MACIVAMVLAGGRVDELSVLTLYRPKSAVSYGGVYRIIDFTLSNIMHSDIDQVGILSQYRPSSLMDHIGTGASWDFVGRRRTARILPPYSGASAFDWYKGTADALYQNLDFIHSFKPDYVLVLSGDHIYKMDYGPLIAFHQQNKAHITAVFKAVDPSEAHRYGIATMDSSNRITSYEEKPAAPRSNLASLTIYVFDPAVLTELLTENSRSGQTFHIYNEILPAAVNSHRFFGYTFNDTWWYAKTLDGYYRSQMALVQSPSEIDLVSWEVCTNRENDDVAEMAPARIGPHGHIKHSIIPRGCLVEGVVESSILSPGVHVHPGAHVRNCVLMHRTEVLPDAQLVKVIADKDSYFDTGAQVGRNDGGMANRKRPDSLRDGCTITGKSSHIPANARIGVNCIINGQAPDCMEDGETLK